MARIKTACFTIFSLVLFAAAVGLAQPVQNPQEQEAVPPAVDVTGTWSLALEMGDATLTFAQEEATLTGRISSVQGELELEGEVAGREVVFWGYVEDVGISFYGTVDEEDDNKMTGAMEAGDFYADFTAVRKPGQ